MTIDKTDISNHCQTALRISPTLLLAWLFILLLSNPGRADNSPVLYHTQTDTFGCADPMAARALTDPSKPRRKNPAWVKSTFNKGRCVSITPKSPWRLLSRTGDVALMDYAGTVGPQGSYYLRIAELVDTNGGRPDDPPALPNGPPAPPAIVDGSQPDTPAQAIVPLLAQQAASATSPNRPVWTTADIFLLLAALALAAAGGFVLGRQR